MIKSIQELQEQSVEDLKFNKSNLEGELLRTPTLMNKYLKYHYDYRVCIAKANSKINELTVNRMNYYLGKGQDYEYRDKPFNNTISNQKELERYLQADPDLCARIELLEGFNAAKEFLDEVIQSLRYRNNTIASVIELRKFEVGA